MNKQLVLTSTFAIVSAVAHLASGHGVPMWVQADSLGALSSTGLVFYDASQSKLAPAPAATPTNIRGTVAFHPVYGDGIPTGTILNADASGSSIHPLAMLYWDGTAVQDSPVTAALSRTGVNFSVTPSDTFVIGGALGAYNGTPTGHSSFTVNLPLSAPVGLYAFGFQVVGGAGSENLTRSNTFWGVLNYGVAADDVPAGLAAINSVVPEPSSLALLALGSAFCFAGAVRRKWTRQ